MTTLRPLVSPLLATLTVAISWPIAANFSLTSVSSSKENSIFSAATPKLTRLTAQASEPTLPSLQSVSSNFENALSNSSSSAILPSSAFVVPTETLLPTVDETPLSIPVQTSLSEASINTIVVQPIGETGTVLSFSTPGYKVRVVARSGDFFMNVFNRRTRRTELQNVPAVISRSSARLNDSNSRFYTAQQGNLTYTAYESISGSNNLIIVPPQRECDCF